jgi:peptidoglycan/LPS O-acetylase OafA/YrhL
MTEIALRHPQAFGMDRSSAINSLTGLRFVAALSVLIAHATNWIVTFDSSPKFIEYLSRGSAP